MTVQKCSLSDYEIYDIQEARVLPLTFDEYRQLWRYLTRELPTLGGKFEYAAKGIVLKPFPHDTLILFQWSGCIRACGIMWRRCKGYYQFDPDSIRMITPITSAELRRINADPKLKRLCRSMLYLCGSREKLDPRRLRRLLALLGRKRDSYLRKRGVRK